MFEVTERGEVYLNISPSDLHIDSIKPVTLNEVIIVSITGEVTATVSLKTNQTTRIPIVVKATKERLYYTPDKIDHDLKAAYEDFWNPDVSWEEYAEKYPLNTDKHYVRPKYLYGDNLGRTYREFFVYPIVSVNGMRMWCNGSFVNLQVEEGKEKNSSVVKYFLGKVLIDNSIRKGEIKIFSEVYGPNGKTTQGKSHISIEDDRLEEIVSVSLDDHEMYSSNEIHKTNEDKTLHKVSYVHSPFKNIHNNTTHPGVYDTGWINL